jgi:hypothetical protein
MYLVTCQHRQFLPGIGEKVFVHPKIFLSCINSKDSRSARSNEMAIGNSPSQSAFGWLSFVALLVSWKGQSVKQREPLCVRYRAVRLFIRAPGAGNLEIDSMVRQLER